MEPWVIFHMLVCSLFASCVLLTLLRPRYGGRLNSTDGGGCRGAASFGDGGGSYRASCIRCWYVGKVFRFNHKIMINV